MSSTWNTISGDWDSQTREWNQIPFSPAKADLTLTGQVPSAIATSIAIPAKADLTLTGNTPTAIENSIALPAKGDLTLTGKVPVATENE